MELCIMQFWGVVWEKIIDASPFLTLCVIVVGLFFSWRQLRNLSKASTASSYVGLFNFLQEDGMREARRYLLTELTKKPYGSWLEKDKHKAGKVCGAYDTVAAMEIWGLIGKEFFQEKWRSSIIECWEAAEPMIKEYQKKRGSDFWSDFEWLYNKAKKKKRVNR